MTRDYIKQDIAHLLETISEQVENIYAHANKIPQIELDIVLNNVRNLYEQFIALKKINNSSGKLPQADTYKLSSSPGISFSNLVVDDKSEDLQQAKPIEPVSVPGELNDIPAQPVVIQEKIEILAANKVDDLPLPIKPVEISSELKPELMADEKINIQEEVVVKAITQEQKNTSKKTPKSAASLFDAPPSLGEKFDDARTLKEKLTSSKPSKSVADQIHRQKIDDLKKVIGINEKFLFINELFEGSLASYNENIDKINSATELNHAQSIIDSLIAKYNWDADQPIVKKFLELAERRFN